MYLVELTPLARTDLEEIWVYTYNQWSELQADRYLDDLNNGFQRLALDVNLGIPVEEIRLGYRKYRVNRHLIFYRISEKDKRLLVIRILHERMEFEIHLL